MKKNNLFIIIFLMSYTSYCQTVKLNVGRTTSAGNSSVKELGILNRSINTLNLAIGIDLLEKENYYLSNEISYTALGGKEINEYLEEPYNSYEKKWSYISASSSFRYKFNFDETTFMFLGAGAKISILTDSKDFSKTIYDNIYTMKPCTLGALSEIGFIRKFSEKYKVGIVGSYVYNITPNSKTEYNNFRLNPFAVNLTLGYSL